MRKTEKALSTIYHLQAFLAIFYCALLEGKNLVIHSAGDNDIILAKHMLVHTSNTNIF